MENQTFIIEDELKKLPGKPGVYLMHGEKDEIIYVGKAISLKNRVRQYFQPSRNRGAKIDQMVTHITRFEYIVTDSELEALSMWRMTMKRLFQSGFGSVYSLKQSAGKNIWKSMEQTPIPADRKIIHLLLR